MLRDLFDVLRIKWNTDATFWKAEMSASEIPKPRLRFLVSAFYSRTPSLGQGVLLTEWRWGTHSKGRCPQRSGAPIAHISKTLPTIKDSWRSVPWLFCCDPYGWTRTSELLYLFMTMPIACFVGIGDWWVQTWLSPEPLTIPVEPSNFSFQSRPILL